MHYVHVCVCMCAWCFLCVGRWVGKYICVTEGGGYDRISRVMPGRTQLYRLKHPHQPRCKLKGQQKGGGGRGLELRWCECLTHFIFEEGGCGLGI